MDHLNPSEYYRAERSPYYIVAPDYREGSSGIRVLHYLCHILNLHGQEAYVQAGAVNEALWVPQLDEKIMRRHYVSRRKPIVIYPEVVPGTPLGLGIKVRYLLNKPGFIAGHKAFDDDEILVAYREPFIADSGAKDILLLPACDPTKFNHENTDPAQRQGRYFFYYRLLNRGGQLLPITAEASEISPAKHRSLDELAAIFKKAELLYCYEDSAIALEARMCGCPVVYIPNPTMLAEYPTDSFGRDGAAWGTSDEEIARAKATVHKVLPTYMKLYGDLQGQLERFVAMTQEAARQTPFEACYPSATISRKGWPVLASNGAQAPRSALEDQADHEYAAWRKRKSLQEIDGQLLAERMTLAWKTRPHINIVIDLRANEANLLADTIDSLATQWYADWHLTIVSDFPPADPALAEFAQITWQLRTPLTPWKEAVDKAIAGTPGDWLLIVEPGNTLEPHALAYLADSINLYPGSRLLYCDEDVRHAGGDLGSPRFKPDFNGELLRSTYYFGPALLVERAAFLAAGGWGSDPGSHLYDLALRMLDNCGADSIKHVSEVLLHTPAESYREINTAAEFTALHAHLERNHVAAETTPGFLHGTQTVRYKVINPALVSIIIPSRDQPGYLSHCVESLLRQTTYRNWELILVDHDTRDPDALDYIDQLGSRPEMAERLRCVRTGGDFNYARLCNLGAAEANGQYLLFLDNDTEIIQPAWLELLLAYLQQPGIVAVGPRLSKPDANLSIIQSGPRLLGVGGLASGMAQDKTNLLEPGYGGRLQVAQETMALTGSCFMVRSEDFHRLKGFDELNTPIYEPVLELCLRLRQNGGRVIWTPWVDVAHHGGITRNRLEADVTNRVRMTETALAERNYFYAKHMASLANDPYYHRHLSLHQPFAIDAHAVIDWDTRFHDRLRILGQPLTSGSGEYRMLSPFRALQMAGLAQTCFIHPVGHKQQRVLNPIELARAAPDVLMLQQAIDDLQITQLKQYRRYNQNVFITYAVDDVLGNLPRKHYLYNFQAREGKSRMREGLSHCDRLIASTQPIADYCQGMIDDIVVVPNRLAGSQWLGVQAQRGMGKKPRVGWAGAQQHLGDLEMIKEVVEALHDEVDWIFMGMCPDFLKPYVAEEHPFVSFAEYPAKLAALNLDLAIAPLEQHFFNEGKSNLRLLEYGIMGWPVICTDIYPYRTNDAPVKRVANESRQWINAIRERINDLDSAYSEGDALRAWVLKHYIIEDHLDEWLDALTPRPAG
ncbi:MAG: glycosyl transferase family 2 [Proteobacteria bacterium]|nr:glycosyl transferase family 2 [Pseudomonadota bacterium]